MEPTTADNTTPNAPVETAGNVPEQPPVAPTAKVGDEAVPITPVGSSIEPENLTAQNILDGKPVEQPTFVTPKAVPDDHVAKSIMGQEPKPTVIGAAPVAADTPTETPGEAVVPPSIPGVEPPANPTPASSAAPPAGVVVGGKKRRFGKKSLGILAVIVLLVLLGGGFVFGYYLPNQPQNVYKSGLSNTAKGYDKLVSYLSDQQKQQYKGATTDGSLKLTAGSVSGEGSFSSQSNGGNSTGKLDLDISGEKFTANFRSVQPSGQSTPDIYLQLTGIKSTLDSNGLNSLDNLDGQWISIDHTLLDGLANMANSKGSSQKSSLTAPTQSQIEDALQKIGSVNQKYIFTTGNQAVLQQKKYLGKSTVEGRSVYGYQVGYNKTNLKAYVQALGTALDGSTLNTWAKQATGKSISDSMNTAELDKSIDSAKADYTFTMYIDAQTKLIHQLHFTDTTNPANNYVNVGLNYTGGSDYPFVLELHSVSGGDTIDGKLTLTLNTATNKLSLGLSGTGKAAGSPFNVTFKADVTPSNTAVHVTVPTGAKPITELLQNIGLGGLLGDSSGSGTTPNPNKVNVSDPIFLTQ